MVPLLNDHSSHSYFLDPTTVGSPINTAQFFCYYTIFWFRGFFKHVMAYSPVIKYHFTRFSGDLKPNFDEDLRRLSMSAYG